MLSNILEALKSVYSFIRHAKLRVKLKCIYLPNFSEQNTIKCPRCRIIKENARKLLKKGPTISGNDVKGICLHCKLKDTSCQECQDVVKSFVPSTPEQTDVGKERVMHWLGKIKLLLDDASKDKKMDHSDIQNNRLYRNLKQPVREPDVEQLFGPRKLDSVSSIRPLKDKKQVTGFPQLEKIEHPILFKDPLKRGVMSSFPNEDMDFYTDSDFSKTMLNTQPEGVKHKITKYTTPLNNRERVGQVDPLPTFDKKIENASTIENNYATKQSSMTAKDGIETKFIMSHKQSPRGRHNYQWSDETNLNQKAHLYTKVKDSQDGQHRKYNSTETLVTKIKDINLSHLQANDIIFPKRLHNNHILKLKNSSELINHTVHKLYVKDKEEKRVVKEDKPAKQQSLKIFPKIDDTEKHSSSATRKGHKALELANKTQRDAQKAALIAERNAKKAEKNTQKADLIAEKNSKTAERDAQKAVLLAEKNSKTAEKDAQKAALLAEKNSKTAEKDAQKAALFAENNSKTAEKDARPAKKDTRQVRSVAQKDASKSETNAQNHTSKNERDAQKEALKRNKENFKKLEHDALEAARQAEINALKAARKAEKDSIKIPDALNERDQKKDNKQQQNSNEEQKKDNFMKYAKKDKIKASLPEKIIRTGGKTVYRGFDEIISKLVKLKQLAHEGIHHASRDLRKAQNYIDIHCEQHTHHKNEHCVLCANSDIALEFASLCPDNEIKEDLSDIIVGQKILKLRPPKTQIEDVSEEKDIDKHRDISVSFAEAIKSLFSRARRSTIGYSPKQQN